jgi:hypothetical protein
MQEDRKPVLLAGTEANEGWGARQSICVRRVGGINRLAQSSHSRQSIRSESETVSVLNAIHRSVA